MNSDFKDLLRCLSANKVKYLIIGGYAVSYYSEPRYTKDLDLWVESTKQNSKRLVKALQQFGAPTDNLSPIDFAEPDILFVFGIPPNRVDILTKARGVSFAAAWKDRETIALGRVPMQFVSRRHLKKLKKTAGRAQDLLDLKKL